MKPRLRRLVAQQLEARVRKLISTYHLQVIAVGGSVGKTTTKLAISQVLRQKYGRKVHAHEGNFNMEISVPLAIFDLDIPEQLQNPIKWFKVWQKMDEIISDGSYPYRYLVLELGIDTVGEMSRHLGYLDPNVAVLTAISPEHMEQLGDMETVTKEEFILAERSQSALLNAEDELMMAAAKNSLPGVETYGVKTGGVHFSDIKRADNLTLGATLHLSEDQIKVQTQFVGQHSLSALAAAAAIGESYGLSPEQIKEGLESFGPVAGRMRVLDGAEGSILLDDSYNSSPKATIAALETLKSLPGRKIAILGSMNELGEYSPAAHKEVGEATAGVDIVVTVGEEAGRHMVPAVASSGVAADDIHSFHSPYAAGKFVRQLLAKGDVVLVKGSQNQVFTEEALAILLADPGDRSKLVRQSDHWRSVKKSQFEDAQ